MATAILMVGLPGVGKTVRARELEQQWRALRLTPDEWIIPLFGEPEASGKRDVLEGRLIWTALRVAEQGVSVVLDFGLWSRDERSALRWLFAAVGADCRVEHLDLDAETQPPGHRTAGRAAPSRRSRSARRRSEAGARPSRRPPPTSSRAVRCLLLPSDTPPGRHGRHPLAVVA